MRFSTYLATIALIGSATLCQAATLVASDREDDDYFGTSVGISGSTAIVGAWGDDDGGSSSGAAYLFDTTTGTQTHKLTASDAGRFDLFGSAVAISGSTAIVGAPRDDDGRGPDNTRTDSGAAYLFDTATGTQIAKLKASDASGGDWFGDAVAISGSTAIVGARYDDLRPSRINPLQGASSGSAYLFDTTTGAQLHKLVALDARPIDFFGDAVAISGSTAIIGAPGISNGGGAAYLFDTTTGTQIAKLEAPDTSDNRRFGAFVAISGSIAIVSDPFADNVVAGSLETSSGAAYLFDTTTGAQIAKLTAPNLGQNNFFGSAVAISGTTAIVADRSGDSFYFDTRTGTPFASFNNRYARVALSGSTAIFGDFSASFAGQTTGAARIVDTASLTAPVPLPAGIWLLGAALGLFGSLRWVNRSRTA